MENWPFEPQDNSCSQYGQSGLILWRLLARSSKGQCAVSKNFLLCFCIYYQGKKIRNVFFHRYLKPFLTSVRCKRIAMLCITIAELRYLSDTIVSMKWRATSLFYLFLKHIVASKFISVTHCQELVKSVWKGTLGQKTFVLLLFLTF